MASADHGKPAPRKTWWGGAEPSNKITIEALAKMLGLPSWDEIDELNRDYYADCAAGACDIDPSDHDSEPFDAQIKAEEEAQAEIFGKWHGAVLAAASALFEAHDLDLVELMPKGAPAGARSWDFRIVPHAGRTWQSAADKIRETINGIGYFYFSTLAEFLASGPYTARRAVLAHLGVIARYPEVYGSASARRIYEGSWS